MKACEAVHILGMIQQECEKEHMESEAEACELAIKVLNFWDLNVRYIHELEHEGDHSTGNCI